MSKKEILDNNKLMADFIGMAFSGHSYAFKENLEVSGEEVVAFPFYYPTDLKFHTSWDWLMRVVKKVFRIIKKLKQEHLYVGDAAVNISCLGIGSHIEDVYDAALKFIVWHNSITTVSAGKKLKETDDE